MNRKCAYLSSVIIFVAWSFSAPAATKTSTITQTAKLTASDGTQNQSFGLAIAVSGNTVAVGAPGSGNGAAYVFVEPSTGWVDANQTAKLTSTSASFNLGASIATNASTVVVGAPVNTNEVRSEADVFLAGGSGWQNTTQTATLTASNASAVNYGLSTAILQSGTVIFVGWPVKTGSFDGAVGLYKEPAAGWVNATQSRVLFPPAHANAQDFGWAVATDGNTVVISDTFANGSKGAVFVYSLAGGTLTEEAELTASDAAAGDHLGTSVAINGNTIVAGSPGQSGVGRAYVFVEPLTGWADMTQTAELSGSGATSGGEVGQSVAIESSVIVAGAPRVTVGGNADQGVIYGFLKPASGWIDATQNFSLVASDGAAGDSLGYSVAAGNGIVVAGAFGKDSSTGAAYVFTKPAVP